jgi:hypothetical protein
MHRDGDGRVALPIYKDEHIAHAPPRTSPDGFFGAMREALTKISARD